MNAIYLDPSYQDEVRRQKIYEGQLIVHSPTPSSLALIDFAKSMLKEYFGELDPEMAQFQMEVEKYAEVLAQLKPKFIHHPRSKECLQGILRELDCDMEKTYFDVPRMRSSTSDGYLTTGIAYAFHPHRDTWYSAPFCQINWWMPIFPITADNGMAFHPRYWDLAVKNGSHDYNYTEWNRTSRLTAAQHVKVDTRRQPKPEEPMELDPQIRVIQPPGSILLFSAAQMHSSVPNTSGRTRFGTSFRHICTSITPARWATFLTPPLWYTRASSRPPARRILRLIPDTSTRTTIAPRYGGSSPRASLTCSGTGRYV